MDMSVRANWVKPTDKDRIVRRENLIGVKKTIMRFYWEDVRDGKVAEPSSVPATSKR
jgi:hypothetical protein